MQRCSCKYSSENYIWEASPAFAVTVSISYAVACDAESTILCSNECSEQSIVRRSAHRCGQRDRLLRTPFTAFIRCLQLPTLTEQRAERTSSNSSSCEWSTYSTLSRSKYPPPKPVRSSFPFSLCWWHTLHSSLRCQFMLPHLQGTRTVHCCIAAMLHCSWDWRLCGESGRRSRSVWMVYILFTSKVKQSSSQLVKTIFFYCESVYRKRNINLKGIVPFSDNGNGLSLEWLVQNEQNSKFI